MKRSLFVHVKPWRLKISSTRLIKLLISLILQDEEILLEAQITNTTPHPLHMHKVLLEPSPLYTVSDLNFLDSGKCIFRYHCTHSWLIVLAVISTFRWYILYGTLEHQNICWRENLPIKVWHSNILIFCFQWKWLHQPWRHVAVPLQAHTEDEGRWQICRQGGKTFRKKFEVKHCTSIFFLIRYL